MGGRRFVNASVKAANIDAGTFPPQIEHARIKDQLKANTEEAADRGAFGAPTLFVGKEMFWGFDRMRHVEYALR